jgi:hypothetical protein
MTGQQQDSSYVKIEFNDRTTATQFPCKNTHQRRAFSFHDSLPSLSVCRTRAASYGITHNSHHDVTFPPNTYLPCHPRRCEPNQTEPVCTASIPREGRRSVLKCNINNLVLPTNQNLVHVLLMPPFGLKVCISETRTETNSPRLGIHESLSTAVHVAAISFTCTL